jgi:hypothetical protein
LPALLRRNEKIVRQESCDLLEAREVASGCFGILGVHHGRQTEQRENGQADEREQWFHGGQANHPNQLGTSLSRYSQACGK